MKTNSLILYLVISFSLFSCYSHKKYYENGALEQKSSRKRVLVLKKDPPKLIKIRIIQYYRNGNIKARCTEKHEEGFAITKKSIKKLKYKKYNQSGGLIEAGFVEKDKCYYITYMENDKRDTINCNDPRILRVRIFN